MCTLYVDLLQRRNDDRASCFLTTQQARCALGRYMHENKINHFIMVWSFILIGFFFLDISAKRLIVKDTTIYCSILLIFLQSL